jgi:hypothetical protein
VTMAKVNDLSWLVGLALLITDDDLDKLLLSAVQAVKLNHRYPAHRAYWQSVGRVLISERNRRMTAE